jgi:hypothetical protein
MGRWVGSSTRHPCFPPLAVGLPVTGGRISPPRPRRLRHRTDRSEKTPFADPFAPIYHPTTAHESYEQVMPSRWLLFDVPSADDVRIVRVDAALLAGHARAGSGKAAPAGGGLPRLLRIMASTPVIAGQAMPPEGLRQADGQLTAPAEDRLLAAEDRLADKLQRAVQARLAGVVTHLPADPTAPARREFFLYCSEHAELSERLLARACNRFAPFGLAFAHTLDPAWAKFDKHLRPTPQQLRRGQDAQVVSELLERGDPLTPARPVRHVVEFPDRPSGHRFAGALQALGFRLANERQSEGPTVELIVERPDPVDLDSISAVTWTLSQLAEQSGGRYRDWSAGVAASAGQPATGEPPARGHA